MAFCFRIWKLEIGAPPLRLSIGARLFYTSSALFVEKNVEFKRTENHRLLGSGFAVSQRGEKLPPWTT
jgi:hypothetical protein